MLANSLWQTFAKKVPLINQEWGHYREISDWGLNVLNAWQQGQSVKAKVWNFTVMTKLTRLISYYNDLFHTGKIFIMPGHYKKFLPAQQPTKACTYYCGHIIRINNQLNDKNYYYYHYCYHLPVLQLHPSDSSSVEAMLATS